MDQIKLTLPNGDEKLVDLGTTALDIASSIGSGLAKASVAAVFDGKLIDLRMPLKRSGSLRLLTLKDEESEEVLRHSAEHVMAEAVQNLFPEAKVDVGRSDHSEKFQYDFRVKRPFTETDLQNIEDEANRLLKNKAEFNRRVLTRKEAKAFFSAKEEDLKVKRIDDIPDSDEITVYTSGAFEDLCRGPHVQHTGQIGAIKLMDSSSVYWKGDEQNEALQRIYGTAFSTKKKLDEHLAFLEEVKKRDHRRLGKQLSLFSIDEKVGPGLILWHPKGALVRHLIEEFWKEEHLKAGYEFVYSPHIAKKDLWETSGHTEFYSDNMFSGMELDGQEYVAKPMNCPFHVQVYGSQLRSYRELPLRMAELGTVYRYERSGVLHGLLRVRGFTQDDAHLFTSRDQLEQEIVDVLSFVKKIFGAFGFREYELFLSTRPEKSVGSDEDWNHATRALELALKKSEMEFKEDPGEGVFYGPKIDIKIKDSIGRLWQCSTIQVDFNLPKRFELEYVEKSGEKEVPIMIHRALLGSVERFFGIMVESCNGAFPLWLAPVQVQILPITDEQNEYAMDLSSKLKSAGIRVSIDDRREKLGFKIREAQLQKIPYMLVLGEKELSTQKVSPRHRSGKQLEAQSLTSFLEHLKKEEAEKHL